MSDSLIMYIDDQRIEYQIHDLADAYPWIADEEFDKLVSSVEGGGIVMPISMWRDPEDDRVFLVDGRNRIKALETVQGDFVRLSSSKVIWVDAKDYNGVNAHIIKVNDRRRDLTQGQKYKIAKVKREILKEDALKRVGKSKTKGVPGDPFQSTKTRDQIAKEFDMGATTAARLITVWNNENQDVEEALYGSRVSPKLADRLVKAVPSKERQSEIVSKPIKEIREEVKKAETIKKMKKLDEVVPVASLETLEQIAEHVNELPIKDRSERFEYIMENASDELKEAKQVREQQQKQEREEINREVKKWHSIKVICNFFNADGGVRHLEHYVPDIDSFIDCYLQGVCDGDRSIRGELPIIKK